jgi:uncharacterized protein DUF4375
MTSELRGYLDLQDDEDLAREVGYYVLRKVDATSFEKLSRPEQVIACLTEVEMEVNNGGFDQFYWNSPGDRAREAVAALEELGAQHTATLLKDANGAFYEYKDDLSQLAAKYIRRHRDEFTA